MCFLAAVILEPDELPAAVDHGLVRTLRGCPSLGRVARAAGRQYIGNRVPTRTGRQKKSKVLNSVGEEMANQSTGGDKRIDRRSVLQVGTALAATGLLHGRDAEAQ